MVVQSDRATNKPKIKSFVDNDLVWVRLRGQPWWPARVCPAAETGQWLVGDKYHVVFYGDDTEMHVTGDKLGAWRRNGASCAAFPSGRRRWWGFGGRRRGLVVP